MCTGSKDSVQLGRKKGWAGKRSSWLLRGVMRGVLGRERSNYGGSKQNFVAHTKFTVTDERYDIFSLPFASGHLYTICKLSVLNNRIIVSQIKVNICE